MRIVTRSSHAPFHWTQVKYKVLFDAGHMGTFLAELKRQHLDEIMSYTSEVESAIFGSTSEGSVSSLKAVKTAIQDLDPDKDPQHIDFMLAAATHTPREHLPWGKELRAATLAEHCRRVLQRRYTPTREKYVAWGGEGGGSTPHHTGRITIVRLNRWGAAEPNVCKLRLARQCCGSLVPEYVLPSRIHLWCLLISFRCILG